MTDPATPITLAAKDPLAVGLTAAIESGTLDELFRLLNEHPGLASARIAARRKTWRTPSEAPMHWAASNDDVDEAAALIDGEADIEAPGASIAGGSPLNNAVGYGCRHVARLLVERGATVGELWLAAALGMDQRVEALLDADPPSQEGLDEAFWQACHGGHLRTAQLLQAPGARINAVPGYADGQTPLDIAASLDERRSQLVRWLGEHGAKMAAKPTSPSRRTQRRTPMTEHELSEAVSLRWNEPLAVELTAAVQRGDAERLRQMLDRRPELARVRIIAQGDTFASRTLLHLFADWPGHRRNPQGIVAVLQAAGADLNVSGDPAKVAETPLHWAASNDDVELVDALFDAGADINVPGSIINGLGPVADAAVFGGVRAGRRLVERGAVSNIYQAAALGIIDLVRAELAAKPAPDAERVTVAFWAACGSGNHDIAELFLGHGAAINWLGWGDKTALDQAREADSDDLATWLESHGAKPAAELADGFMEVDPGHEDRAVSVASHLLPATDDAHAGFAPRFPTVDIRAALAHYESWASTLRLTRTGPNGMGPLRERGDPPLPEARSRPGPDSRRRGPHCRRLRRSRTPVEGHRTPRHQRPLRHALRTA